MRLYFRVTLAAVMAIVVVGSVASAAWVSYRNGDQNARALSAQIVEQTLRRIELQTRALLETATAKGHIGRIAVESGELLGPGVPTTDDFPALSRYCTAVLETAPELSYYGLALESTGEYSVAERKVDGTIEIREYAHDANGRMEVLFWRATGSARALVRKEEWTGYDPRKRPFYIPAKAAGEQVWTDTYAFWDTSNKLDASESREVPGVSCVTPAYVTGADGERVLGGVIDADFDLFVLCDFLAEVGSEVPGIAFIVEHRADGTQRAIAHPDATQLVHREVDGARVVHRLVETIGDVRDTRVAAFMQEHAARANPVDGVVEELDLEHDGDRYLGGYLPLRGEGLPRWTLAMLLPRDEVLAHVDANNRYTGMIGIVCLFVSLVLGIVVSSWLANPVRQVADQSTAIGSLQLDGPRLGGSLVLEIDRLMGATEDMKQSLRSFQKYVPADLVREILASGEHAELGAHRARLTVFFSDIAGFTSISEALTPPELVRQLGEYLGAMTDEIEAVHGTVDKYIGDAVVAFWGAPRIHASPELAGCRAALACQAQLAALRDRWVADGRPPFHARIGLNTGDMLVGNVGSPSRLDYTVMGPEAHHAEHLEALNKAYGTRIMIGAQTHAGVADQVVVRPLDRIRRGDGRIERVYELLAMIEDATDAQRSLAADYGAALQAYVEGRFEVAREGFEAVLAKHPGDPPSAVMLARLASLGDAAPSGWDGVFDDGTEAH